MNDETYKHRAESYRLQCEAMRQDRLKAYEEVKKLEAWNKVFREGLEKIQPGKIDEFIPSTVRKQGDIKYFVAAVKIAHDALKAKSLESEGE